MCSVPEGVEDQLQSKPPSIDRVGGLARLVVKQTVREAIPKIWAGEIAEQRLDLKTQILAEYMLSLFKLHERAQAVLGLYPFAVQGRGYAILLQVEAYRVLNLRHQEVKSRDKITVISGVQGFAEEEFPPYRYEGRLSGETDEIGFPQAVFQKENLLCRQNIPPDGKNDRNAVVTNHLGENGFVIVTEIFGDGTTAAAHSLRRKQ